MRKEFRVGDRVRVRPPHEKPFCGTVYGEFTDPGRMRRILVERTPGFGTSHPVSQVTLARARRPAASGRSGAR